MHIKSLFAAAACVLLPCVTAAQGLTGALIGTVRDAQGGIVAGAEVRISSPALIGGPVTLTTNEKGQLRFPALPPGPYVLVIERQGFESFREADIRIGAGATIERTAVLKLAGLAESVVVEGTGSRIDARDPGVGTRFGQEDLRTIPTRRSSMFDFIRATPGVSPTSPASGTSTTVSAFGSGTNENQFLFDGTNVTCPCNGVSRSEPGVDFIQEIHVQSVGASAEFGNVQGAVINVVTRQGGDRFLYDASYYGQSAGLTSQPVPPFDRPGRADTNAPISRPDHEPRRACSSRSPLVLRRLSVPARLRQPAGHRPCISENLRARQGFCQAHLETDAWHAIGAEHPQRVGNQPRSPDPCDALSSHRTAERFRTGADVRPSDTHAVHQYALGRPRWTVCLHPRGRTQHGQSATAASRLDRVSGVSSGAPPRFGSLRLCAPPARPQSATIGPECWERTTN